MFLFLLFLSEAIAWSTFYSGKRLHAYRWKELPIDSDVIDRVHKLGIADSQPASPIAKLLFEWTPGSPIDEDQGAQDTDSLFIDQFTNPHPAFDDEEAHEMTMNLMKVMNLL